MASKPKPAPVYDKLKKSYKLYFCYNGKPYFGPYIANQHVAYCLQAKVNSLVIQFKHGLLPLPPNISLKDFIFDSAAPKPDPEKTNHPTVIILSDLIREYQKLVTPPLKHITTCHTEKIHLRHLQDFLSQQKDNPWIEDLNVGFFNQYKKFRYSQGVGTDTVKKELGTFQSMFKMAVENGYVKYNVVRDVQRDKSQAPSDRFRTHAEIQELLKKGSYSPKEIQDMKRFQYLALDEVEELISLAKDHWLYPILATFGYTGMRRGELVKLEWTDVDLEKKCLYAKSHKQSQNRKETVRGIPINDGLLPILLEQKLKTGSQRWVFLSTIGEKIKENSLSQAFQRFVKGTKFEGLGFHAFRHSAASNLAAQGEDQRVIDRILGHQTEAMRQRYQHLYPQQLESAMKKLQQV